MNNELLYCTVVLIFPVYTWINLFTDARKRHTQLDRRFLSWFCIAEIIEPVVTGSIICVLYLHFIRRNITLAETHFPAEQFRPTKAFSFPKRQFGCKGDQRSFHA